MNKKNKLFISHSSLDSNYVTAIVELLEDIGLGESDLFCSSIPGYNIPNGEDIYNYLLKQFEEFDLKIYYVLSDNYYSSVASLNEMGAAWAIKNSYFTILLPKFDFNQIQGVINPRQTGLKLDNNIEEVNSRLNGIKDELISTFELNSLSAEKWERIRDKFVSKINSIATTPILATATAMKRPF